MYHINMVHNSFAVTRTICTLLMKMQSMDIIFEPWDIRQAVINAIRRLGILGNNTLINAETITVNEKCEIEFEISDNNAFTKYLYDNNITIAQNNFRFITMVLVQYNTDKIDFLRSNDAENRYIFSVDCVNSLWYSCAHVSSISDMINMVQDVNVEIYKGAI